MTAPYLHADAERAARRRQEFSALPGRKVGISWQGYVGHRNDRRRSLPLAHFAPLCRIDDVQLVRLQRGPGSEQMEHWSERPILEPTNWPDDPAESWAETAAVIASLDLAIVVDTAVAHLAGALGVPTWVLLPFAPDWRWELERDDSRWYPSVRLFRQRQTGDWADVFARVAEELSR